MGSRNSSVGAELVKLLSHYIIYIGQQTGLIHSSIDNLTSRDLLLFETKRSQFTWEPAVCHRRMDCDIADPAENDASTSVTDSLVSMPISAPVLYNALSNPDMTSWGENVSVLDSVALGLLESSDFNMLDDQPWMEQKYTGESSRKDSLGCDLFVDDTTLQIWQDGRTITDLPTLDISSEFYGVDAHESWPCYNRIPSPGPTDVDELLNNVSWETLIQDEYLIPSCGILPSCTSSVPSSPYVSPHPTCCDPSQVNDKSTYGSQ